MSNAPRIDGVMTDPQYDELLSKPTLSVQETAAIIGVNHKTVREALAKGTLTAIRLGRTIRIPTKSVLALLGR
jgi:excisionase family DNA binding protein